MDRIEQIKAEIKGQISGIGDPGDVLLEKIVSFIEALAKPLKIHGWAARNKDGSLFLFEVEPKRWKDAWWDRDYVSVGIDEGFFPDLRWEDDPIQVELPIFRVL